jgi:hypothetical protein
MSDLDNELREIDEFSEASQTEEAKAEPSTEAPGETVTQDQTVQPVTPVEPEIPEKYRGKSISEIIEMHRNAEKLAGDLGRRLGEATRKSSLYETYLQQLQLQQGSQPVQQTTPSRQDKGQEEDLDSIFLDKPTYVIQKVAERVLNQREEAVRQQQEALVKQYKTIQDGMEWAEYQAIAMEDPSFSQSRLATMSRIVRENPTWNKEYQDALNTFDPTTIGRTLRKLNEEAKKIEDTDFDTRLRSRGIDPEVLKQIKVNQKIMAGGSLGEGGSGGNSTPIDLEAIDKDLAVKYKLLGIKP